MTTFTVCGYVTVSCWTDVEADTKEEALKIAASRSLAEIHIDGSYPVDECWHLDTDGTPTKFTMDY